MRACQVALLLAIGLGLVLGQTASKLEFEVATVKPFAPITGVAPPGGGPRPGQEGGGPGTAEPERVRYRAMTVQALLMSAYGMPATQVTGPAWIDSDRFDIVAKVAPGTTKEQVHIMLQTLLADRFMLVVHRETRELPVYELVAGKGGAKLKPHADGPPGASPAATGEIQWSKDGRPIAAPGELIGILMPPGRWSYTATKQKLDGPSSLVNLHSREMGRPVINKTGLAGEYDWTLEFRDVRPTRVNPPDLDAPEISAAVEEQLGLKLESKKGPVEILVVDSGSKTPSEN